MIGTLVLNPKGIDRYARAVFRFSNSTQFPIPSTIMGLGLTMVLTPKGLVV
jgi:hypothetical protein